MNYSILEALKDLQAKKIEEAEEPEEQKIELDDKKEEIEDKEKEIEDKEEPIALRVEDYQKWVDYDMEHYGEISERTNELIAKAGFQVVKDDHDDYEVVAGHFE